MQTQDRRPSGDPETSAPAEDRSRRGFLRSSAAATGLVLGGGALASARTPLKHGGGTSGHKKGGGGGRPVPENNFEVYPGQNARNFREIQADEDAHVPAVINAITSLGGTPRPKPTFQPLLQPNLGMFYAVSNLLENTGVGAYQAAAPLISSSSVLATAASIAFVEALHSGFLNNLLNYPLVPGGGSFSQPLPVPEIVRRASGLIVSLNGGPDPSTEISTTPSPANDIAILNFALLLEYLEKEFYDINVPHYFPQGA